MPPVALTSRTLWWSQFKSERRRLPTIATSSLRSWSGGFFASHVAARALFFVSPAPPLPSRTDKPL
jgi:hypothetical protein